MKINLYNKLYIEMKDVLLDEMAWNYADIVAYCPEIWGFKEIRDPYLKEYYNSIGSILDYSTVALASEEKLDSYEKHLLSTIEKYSFYILQRNLNGEQVDEEYLRRLVNKYEDLTEFRNNKMEYICRIRNIDIINHADLTLSKKQAGDQSE